jgi:hypothetical protein
MLGVIAAHRDAQAPDIEIRAPLSGRLAYAGILALGTVMAGVVTIALIGRGTIWAVLAAGALAVWVAYFYRLTNLAVVVRGDTLRARNLFSTHRVEASTVRAVTLGESSVAKSPNQTVVLVLEDGRRIPLDACARTLQSRRTLRRVEDFQSRLEQWSQRSDTPPAVATAAGRDAS